MQGLTPSVVPGSSRPQRLRGVASKKDKKNPKKQHAKVSAKGSSKAVVINGRVLGPKVSSSSSAGKNSSKLQKTREPVAAKSTAKRGSKGGESAPGSIALEKQLDLPLDALLKRRGNNKA